jgi:UDPglucose 6-dehydrogenase
MQICVIGSGYVGLVTGTCFAEMGNNVICADVDGEKIKKLKNNNIPIYEPGLEEMVRRNQLEKRLHFTTDIKEAIEGSLVVFIAVGTPAGQNGYADLSNVNKVVVEIGKFINTYKVIVNKSTVPVGTGDKVRGIILEEIQKRNLEIEFDVVSNPEFLKEGDAINDFMKPDRVVIGTDNVRTAEIMKELFSPFVRNNHPVLVMDIRSAEMTKYAANSMLACRISFINEIANLCERVGADVGNVRLGIGTDARIGMAFLHPGIGYGGSCFPKDVQALHQISKEHGYHSEMLAAIENINQRQKTILVQKIKSYFGNHLKEKIFTVWGLSFKPNTDDMREAPSISVINELVNCGADIQAYDPVANKEANNFLSQKPGIKYFDNQYDALQGSDALVLVTEWHNFRRPDFYKMKQLMNRCIIFDGRNQYEPGEMKKLGFEYLSIGRPAVIQEAQ